jgi:uncharacterized membrane protein YjjB (DUF3815 family)
MSMDLFRILQPTICGGLAAAGFGTLFNVGFRGMPWCAAGGALTLALRTIALEEGWRLEAATFAAALLVGIFVQVLPSSIEVSRTALHVVSCIPMIPGGFAAKALMGLFALTYPGLSDKAFIPATENSLRVVFTMGALGTGLAIPVLLLRTGSDKASPDIRPDKPRTSA